MRASAAARPTPVPAPVTIAIFGVVMRCLYLRVELRRIRFASRRVAHGGERAPQIRPPHITTPEPAPQGCVAADVPRAPLRTPKQLAVCGACQACKPGNIYFAVSTRSPATQPVPPGNSANFAAAKKQTIRQERKTGLDVNHALNSNAE